MNRQKNDNQRGQQRSHQPEQRGNRSRQQEQQDRGSRQPGEWDDDLSRSDR